MQVSRDSVAYDDEVYRLQKSRRQQSQEALHVVRKQGKTVRRTRRGVFPLQQLMCFALVLFVSGAMIYANVSLTRVTSELAIQQDMLEDLSSESIALKAEKDKSLSLSYVEQYAQNELGMVKLDTNQVEYVEMNNPDQIHVRQTGISVKSAMSGLAKGFNAIVEYIRQA